MRTAVGDRYVVVDTPGSLEFCAEIDPALPAPAGPAKPNRKVLETLMQYLVDQGFVKAPAPAIDPLFTPIVAWADLRPGERVAARISGGICS